MNCQQCQKRIRDAFAAGEATLPDLVVRHKQDCEACQAFCESQASLFRGLEAGLKAIANEVPPSLVPRVRARLNEELPLASSWLPAWGTAAMAAAVLAVGLGSAFLYGPKYHSEPSKNVTVASQGMESPVVVKRESPHAAKPSLSRESKRARAPLVGRGARDVEAMPEVMVLAEERAAFARFVAELPREQGVAPALARGAPANHELTAEIVALEIDSLEVKSLDPTWECESCVWIEYQQTPGI